MSQVENNYPITCFGEILWDVLPNGAVPGGAPMNVAYHLKKLGINPALITRVGLDDEGKKLIQMMERNKISTEFFQMDFELITGKVNANLEDYREVVYEIIKPVAWDNIQWDGGFETLLSNSRYFVFGSLATRSEKSRNTLYKLLEMARFKVLDINLRAPHFNRKIIQKLLNQVGLLKLNLAELELITGWFTDYKSEIDRIRILQDKFQIPNIVVTKGSRGSLFITQDSIFEHPGFKVEVADTIGSGDASLAALITKLLQGETPAKALEFSSALGALIATFTGGCPDYNPEEIDNLIKSDTIVSLENHEVNRNDYLKF
jgi:fructokinase